MSLPICPDCGKEMHSGLVSYKCQYCGTSFSSFSAFASSVNYRLRKKVDTRWSERGMTFAYRLSEQEKAEWILWYTPPESVPRDGLIVSVGARDGDDALFFIKLGYNNLRLIEPNPVYFKALRRNVRIMRGMYPYDIQIEVREKSFDVSDTFGAAFVKFDCEGCEYETDLDNLTMPWSAEFHERKVAKKGGIYDYVDAKGYRRSR